MFNVYEIMGWDRVYETNRIGPMIPKGNCGERGKALVRARARGSWRGKGKDAHRRTWEH